MNKRRLRALLTISFAALLTLSSAAPVAAGLGDWTPIGPPGGHVLALALDPNETGVLYADSPAIGVHRSTDGGEMWELQARGTIPQAPQGIVVAHDAQSTVYVAAGGDLFKSTDRGDTWAETTHGLPSGGITSMGSNPRAPMELYVGKGDDGLFKSSDGGASWTAILTGTASVDAVTVDPTSASTIYAGLSGDAVYRSIDGGETWSSSSAGLSHTHFEVLAVNPMTPTIIYAGTPGGVQKSTDGGATWSPANTLPSGSLSFVADLVMDPDDPQTLYAATSTGVYKTTDGASSWSKASSGLGVLVTTRLVIDPTDPRRLYAATRGGGIFYSDDGASSWTPLNAGLKAHSVQSLLVDEDVPSTIYAGTINAGVYKSTDSGTTWTSLPLRGRFWVVALIEVQTGPGSEAIYAAADGDGGVFKSTDEGQSWQDKSSGITSSLVADVVVDPGASDTLYAATRSAGVFKTANGGDSWSAVNTGLTEMDVRSLAVHPTTSSIVYAGTNDGVFKSTNAGSSWSFVGLKQERVEDLVVDPVDPDVVYAAGDGLSRSTNGGQDWTQPSPVFSPQDLAVSAAMPDRLLVATTSFVVQVRNPRGSWQTTALSEGILNDNVYAVARDAVNERYYAGTDGAGVHAYDIARRVYIPLVLR